MRFTRLLLLSAVGFTTLSTTPSMADPCGMVPPIYPGQEIPLARIGEQQTYVFYKDGVETFVIRPGFTGKVEEFGMLIPFPTPPAIRKVPDQIFSHIAAAVDPPEIVVDLRPQLFLQDARRSFDSDGADSFALGGLAIKQQEVKVLREEAVGMYEVAVLAAGSAEALKRWMDDKGYRYPDGMDKPCNDYVDAGWCFVAVKTKVGAKAGVNPKPGQSDVTAKLPTGASFDGHVQGMGFRFKVDDLVVPMRLSAFNKGELRNIVYLLTDGPRKVRAIPEEYVMRQVRGKDLYRNLTQPLPIRVIGGSVKDIPESRLKAIAAQRDPTPHNGAAKDLFASDLLAATTERLALPHEEKEKELLRIGERMGLRGPEVDKLNNQSLTDLRTKTIEGALDDLKEMTLTVVDGDFPRELLAKQNLTFAKYEMPARRNRALNYDVKLKGPAAKQPGVIHFGHLDSSPTSPTEVASREVASREDTSNGRAATTWTIVGIAVVLLGGVIIGYRRKATLFVVVAFASLLATKPASADPCGMVPPISPGQAIPISRVGLQQTYVFYKDGVETFVIRPGFSGKVDEFGMLIPFPTPPAIRKVPDHVFGHIAAAVDPPEVIVDLRVRAFAKGSGKRRDFARKDDASDDGLEFEEEVRVLRQEAVGMYEVAVLEAGSAAALKRWMDDHGYQYPDGMDKPCNDYVEAGWCFVAVKTKVGDKGGADPKPGQDNVNPKLPSGATFDGHVQGMGFRFEVDKLVVPMRLSAFNKGELRNVVYLLTEGPRKIRMIPEEYVVRQISGEQLFNNLTQPLPLRILGGTEKDIPEYRRQSLKTERDPTPKNGAAAELFASDLLAVATGELSLTHEEREKELLRIGERFGLRGAEIDELNTTALAAGRKQTVDKALADLKTMTLTVVDGDFPRELLRDRNLTFAEYRMPSKRNQPESYDAKINGPMPKKDGVRKVGALSPLPAEDAVVQASPSSRQYWRVSLIAVVAVGLAFVFGIKLRGVART